MAKKLVKIDGLRKHDLKMISQKRRLGYRVVEPDEAECYFCNGIGVKDSQEHIIPQWLQDHLGMRNEIFTPTYYAGPYQPADERGTIPATNMVGMGICVDCNTGWMSKLEVEFKKSFQEKQRNWSSRDTVMWFVKTAMVLNVTQNTRLLVPRDVRLSLAEGMLDSRLSVTFHRVVRSNKTVRDGHFNWVQGGPHVPILEGPPELSEDFHQRLKQCWACSIRLDSIVATVIYTPTADLLASSWKIPGVKGFSGAGIPEKIFWTALPQLSHFTQGYCLVPSPTGDWAALEPSYAFPDGLKEIRELVAFQVALAENLAKETGAEVIYQ